MALINSLKHKKQYQKDMRTFVLYPSLFFLFLFFFSILSACSSTPSPGPQPPPSNGLDNVGIDPTFTWDPVTTDCLGGSISGLSYNVYIITGTGPFPTTQTGGEIPCGDLTLINSSLIAPDNPTPITTTIYQVILPEGTYSVAVEAVTASGRRGPFTQASFNVVLRGASVNNLLVGP
jgi:hypothetical protein